MGQQRTARLPIRLAILLLALAWCGLAGLGMTAMVNYETTPAPTAKAPPNWPSGTLLARDPRRPTLVMFVHPHCPCSRASLNELATLNSRCADQASVQIILVQPEGNAAPWENTSLAQMARRIAGATVLADRDGVEADRFRATTSGETFLYAADGRLLFHGGITPGRGHEGDSAGRAALTALIQQGEAEHRASPVYGCCLQNRCSPAPASTYASAAPHNQ
jgi:hypothetical protein